MDEMAEREVTGFSGVPSTFALLLNRSALRKYQFPKLRYITQPVTGTVRRMTEQVLRPEGLRTGDLARMDKEGYFYIVSRKNDMIKSELSPHRAKEIEEIILHEHEGVHEVAVVGVEDEILGETIKACVVLKQGYECGEKEMYAFAAKTCLPLKGAPQGGFFG